MDDERGFLLINRDLAPYGLAYPETRENAHRAIAKWKRFWSSSTHALTLTDTARLFTKAVYISTSIEPTEDWCVTGDDYAFRIDDPHIISIRFVLHIDDDDDEDEFEDDNPPFAAAHVPFYSEN